MNTNINPYESPNFENELPNHEKRSARDIYGYAGFTLSLLSLSAGFISSAGPVVGTIALVLTLLCVPGIALSILGLRSRARRFARLGIIIGIIVVTVLIPTIGGVAHVYFGKVRHVGASSFITHSHNTLNARLSPYGTDSQFST